MNNLISFCETVQDRVHKRVLQAFEGKLEYREKTEEGSGVSGRLKVLTRDMDQSKK